MEFVTLIRIGILIVVLFVIGNFIWMYIAMEDNPDLTEEHNLFPVKFELNYETYAIFCGGIFLGGLFFLGKLEDEENNLLALLLIISSALGAILAIIFVIIGSEDFFPIRIYHFLVDADHPLIRKDLDISGFSLPHLLFIFGTLFFGGVLGIVAININIKASTELYSHFKLHSLLFAALFQAFTLFYIIEEYSLSFLFGIVCVIMTVAEFAKYEYKTVRDRKLGFLDNVYQQIFNWIMPIKIDEDEYRSLFAMSIIIFYASSIEIAAFFVPAIVIVFGIIFWVNILHEHLSATKDIRKLKVEQKRLKRDEMRVTSFAESIDYKPASSLLQNQPRPQHTYPTSLTMNEQMAGPQSQSVFFPPSQGVEFGFAPLNVNPHTPAMDANIIDPGQQVITKSPYAISPELTMRESIIQQPRAQQWICTVCKRTIISSSNVSYCKYCGSKKENGEKLIPLDDEELEPCDDGDEIITAKSGTQSFPFQSHLPEWLQSLILISPTISCQRCGGNIQTGWKFCPYCNNDIAARIDIISQKRTCKKCGETLEQAWISCPNCNHLIEEHEELTIQKQVCSQCGDFINPDWNFCSSCKTPNPHSTTRIAQTDDRGKLVPYHDSTIAYNNDVKGQGLKIGGLMDHKKHDVGPIPSDEHRQVQDRCWTCMTCGAKNEDDESSNFCIECGSLRTSRSHNS